MTAGVQAVGGTGPARQAAEAALARQPARAAPPGPSPHFGALLAARLQDASAGLPSGTATAGWRRLRLGEMVAGLPPGTPGAAAAAVPAAPAGTPGALAAPAPAAPNAPAALAPGAPDATGAGERIVAAAGSYLGVPYRWGGTDPATGLDCSGLVQRALADLGVAVPRVSADQARAGSGVPSLAAAQPGDLLFWRGSGGRPNHIGVYVGGGQMIHAPRTGDVVKVDRIRAAPPDAIRRVR